MTVIGEPLFINRNHADIQDLGRHVQGKLREMVDRVPDSRFQPGSDDDAIAMVVEEARIEPLVVDFDNAEKSVEETTMGTRDRYGFHGGTIEVPAFRVTKTIPFSGDAGLWTFMTGSWSSSMPRGEVVGNTLVVGITLPTDRAEEAKPYLDRTISEIQEYLQRQKGQIDAFNATLPDLIRPLVEARRSRRNQASDLMDRL